MQYAIFSDIHSNLEALTTFFSIVDHEDLKPVCLGDIVGYSSSPIECLEMVEERDTIVVIGNHDYAILDPLESEFFNPYARAVLQWQRNILGNGWKKYLYDLPWKAHLNDFAAITHADFLHPERFPYLDSEAKAMDSFSGLDASVGFYGHTHRPGIYCYDPHSDTDSGITYQAVKGNNQNFTLDPSRYYLINPGSIGQPRDRDPRASFVIFDAKHMKVTFRRFTYDVDEEAHRIMEQGLPDIFAKRLFEGY